MAKTEDSLALPTFDKPVKVLIVVCSILSKYRQ